MESAPVPQETANNMLQQSNSLGLNEANDHIAQDCSDSIKPLICGTNVAQPRVIQQDLLDNEDGNCLRQFTSGFHDSQTEWNYLCGQEESDRW
jgi:hypothetical protein